MQVDHLDASLCDGVQEVGCEDVHPAGADDDVGTGGEREDDGGEGGVVGGAGGGGAGGGVGVLAFEGEEVVVGGWDGGVGGAGEAVGGFSAGGERMVSSEKGIGRIGGEGALGEQCGCVRTYFEITCVMRVLGRAEEAQASMRAWRLEPLPDMRTVMLNFDSAIIWMVFSLVLRSIGSRAV